MGVEGDGGGNRYECSSDTGLGAEMKEKVFESRGRIRGGRAELSVATESDLSEIIVRGDLSFQQRSTSSWDAKMKKTTGPNSATRMSGTGEA